MNREELIKEDLPFLDSVPDSWSLVPNKWLFKYDGRKVGAKWKDYQLLSLTKDGVKVKASDDARGKVPESYDNYQTVKPDQMVFCLFDLDVSAVFSGISNLNGMITSAYDVFSSTDLVNNKYADYWFKYVFSNRYYKLYSKNIRFTITSDNFGRIKTPLPPLDEQATIASFLQNKEEKIVSLIKNEEAQIEKLKAYKQALISEAVTKGLNTHVPMKDSGVESIGLIPKHWSILPAKYVFDSICKGSGISKEMINQNGDIGCVRYGEIYTKYDFSFDTCVSRTVEEWISPRVYAEQGDILFAGTGELIEEIGKNVVYSGYSKILVGGDIIIGKTHRNSEFLNYALYSGASQAQKSRGKAKLKVVHISANEIGNTIIAIPPEEEQGRIAAYLNDKIKIIVDLEAKHLEKITLLRQYQQSLIYEYVTGKKEIN